MHRIQVHTIALGLALATLACGDGGGDANIDIDFDDDEGPQLAGAKATLRPGDVFATMTENGVIRLGLSEDRVYFELSEVLREHVDSAISSDLEDSENRIARSIGSAVRRGVATALEVDIDYAVDEIRDVHYRAGELVFEFEDPDDGRVLENADVDDEPLTRAFAAEDARAFVAAFRRVKSGQSVDRPAAADSVEPGAAPNDSASGGTF